VATVKSSAKTKAVTAKAGVDFVMARQVFHYGDLKLSRHQVFELQGGRGDLRLVNMRYVTRVEEGTELHQCAECGALFLDPHWLKVHGDMWHSFTCECGWQPRPGMMDVQSAMRKHEHQCPVMRKHRDAAHKEHVVAAQEMQEASGV
jgi:hypothetical protein